MIEGKLLNDNKSITFFYNIRNTIDKGTFNTQYFLSLFFKKEINTFNKQYFS